MTDIQVPQFAFPFRFNPDGSVAVNEQDSLADVKACVAVILSYHVGDRPELPEFGIPDPTFSETVDLGPILAAVERWEPRAQAAATADNTDLADFVSGVLVNVQTP